MLCQNCNKNEANMHMKRIINGNAAEVHLCADCARSLGYGESFRGFGLGELLGDLFLKSEQSGGALRCPSCNKSFEEIAADGKLGCAECYNTFSDRLMPSLLKIHGKCSHIGKHPLSSESGSRVSVESLKSELSQAVEHQDYERAAVLRDRIHDLTKGGEAE